MGPLKYKSRKVDVNSRKLDLKSRKLDQKMQKSIPRNGRVDIKAEKLIKL